jgi:hypothetical protein
MIWYEKSPFASRVDRALSTEGIVSTLIEPAYEPRIGSNDNPPLDPQRQAQSHQTRHQSFPLPSQVSKPSPIHVLRMSKNSWLASKPWKISKRSKPLKLPVSPIWSARSFCCSNGASLSERLASLNSNTLAAADANLPEKDGWDNSRHMTAYTR